MHYDKIQTELWEAIKSGKKTQHRIPIDHDGGEYFDGDTVWKNEGKKWEIGKKVSIFNEDGLPTGVLVKITNIWLEKPDDIDDEDLAKEGYEWVGYWKSNSSYYDPPEWEGDDAYDKFYDDWVREHGDTMHKEALVLEFQKVY